MIMKVELDALNISKAVFLDKIKTDLTPGVRVASGNAAQNSTIVRAWTDTKDWQFSVLGLAMPGNLAAFERVEIQSFGESLVYMKLNALIDGELAIDFEKLSPNFAELAEVEADEAKLFMDGYMQSSFNRTLTSQLFEEFAQSKDYENWLVKS